MKERRRMGADGGGTQDKCCPVFHPCPCLSRAVFSPVYSYQLARIHTRLRYELPTEVGETQKPRERKQNFNAASCAQHENGRRIAHPSLRSRVTKIFPQRHYGVQTISASSCRFVNSCAVPHRPVLLTLI